MAYCKSTQWVDGTVTPQEFALEKGDGIPTFVRSTFAAMHVTIHTDGAASGNPGPGGYGAVLEAGKHRKELWGGFRRTTNNRMELLAVIVALEALKNPGMEVTVVSDSKYVVDAVEKGWVFGWEKKGYAKKANPDLWRRFLVVYRKHKVKFQWVRGHNGHPLNELCDRLAVAASQQKELEVDAGYEAQAAGGIFDE